MCIAAKLSNIKEIKILKNRIILEKVALVLNIKWIIMKVSHSLVSIVMFKPSQLNNPASFTEFLHQHIQPSELLSMQVKTISATQANVQAAVKPANINIHQTAFAGSIYSVCTLAGWSLAHHRLCLEGIDADVVMGKAEITYLAPIVDMIDAHINVREEDMQVWIEKLRSKGKGSVAARIEAYENGVVKAVLQGKLVGIVAPR